MPYSQRAILVRTAGSIFLLVIGFAIGILAYRSPRSRAFLARPARRLGWHREQNRAPVEVESRSIPPQVLSIPYVQGSIDRDPRRGVVAYDRSRAFPGVNFYTSVGGDAWLIDMDGRILYRWSNPAHLAPARWNGTNSFWEFSYLFPDGRLLASRVNGDLVELDERSHVLWICKGRFHHDLDVAANGDIYALTWEAEILPAIHATQPALIDQLLVISGDGVIKRKISLLDLLRRSPYAFLLPSIQDLHVDGTNRELDLIHSNHVEIVGDGAPFPRGSVLLGMRNINAMVVLAPSLDRILSLWGPSNLSFPHDPTLLPSGNVLIFDNGTERSQIIEVNPRTFSIVWRYAPPSGFFSPARGSVQRLPSGNTLITESDRGNAFEITPRGEVVWRFENPDLAPGGLRSAIFRMTRFRPEQLPFLLKLQQRRPASRSTASTGAR